MVDKVVIIFMVGMFIMIQAMAVKVGMMWL